MARSESSQSREDEYDQFEMLLAAAKAEAELKAESSSTNEPGDTEAGFLKKNADIARCGILRKPRPSRVTTIQLTSARFAVRRTPIWNGAGCTR